MDLDIKRVLASKPGEPEDVELVSLTTSWGDDIDFAHVLDEHPRPQFERDSWTCLNGLWEYAICESSAAKELWSSAQPPRVWDGKILVPFSPETALSGVRRQLQPCQLLWYRRAITLEDAKEKSFYGKHFSPNVRTPSGKQSALGKKAFPNRRFILHFEAVDYACACYVNGRRVGMHVGGYMPFDIDITEAVQIGENTIELCVYDPSEQGTQLRGKQRIRRGNMWYTAQSGIWQTVWLEEVPEKHVRSLEVRTDADAGDLTLSMELSEPGGYLVVNALDAQGGVVAAGETIVPKDETSVQCTMHIPSVHMWDIADPYLYGIRVSYEDDEVRSYCAFRTVGVELDDEGTPRFCLNHKPLFLRGLLDQGYWPDGLMTAPSDEALVFDIQTARNAGFNMLRKHVKIEAARWYWHCDRLGMLVMQDMVSGGDLPGEWTSVNIPTLMRKSWAHRSDVRPRSWAGFGAGDADYRNEWLQTARQAVGQLSAHPCVVAWVVFNESWGQFASAKMCDELREVDATRPFVATSGWYDQGAGDFFAVHNYFRGMRVYRDPHARSLKREQRARAFIINEFGGLTCPVEGHTSVPTVYGYDSYENIEAWNMARKELLAEVDALEAEGLSGFVYTQLSDVEEETNGFLTYDRRINKLG